jgi:hypothetical protein
VLKVNKELRESSLAAMLSKEIRLHAASAKIGCSAMTFYQKFAGTHALLCAAKLPFKPISSADR